MESNLNGRELYREKVLGNLKESFNHLERLSNGFIELQKSFKFPIDSEKFEEILNSNQLLAYSDQIIYRFSKLQDSMGAKLFKSLLLYQGENVNRPFIDILNQLEKIEIIDVDGWFEIRDLRNEIAHDYNSNDEIAMEMLNSIFRLKDDLRQILEKIEGECLGKEKLFFILFFWGVTK
jgi:uncharacterized protein with HEPN domain